jgi:anthranilate/para-aminobenzoate synthase component II
VIGAAFGGEIVGAWRIMHGKTSTITYDGGAFSGLPNPSKPPAPLVLVVASRASRVPGISARSEDGEIAARHREQAVEGSSST